MSEERQRLTPFLASHFSASYYDEVPMDVWKSTLQSAERVLSNPAKFPHANVEVLDTLLAESSLFLVRP